MARTLRTALKAVLVGLVGLLLAVVVSVSFFDSPEYARRLIMYRESDTKDYLIFPARVIRNGGPISVLPGASGVMPQTVTWPSPANGLQTENLEQVIQRTDTKAFVVIRNDQILYEGYFNGSKRDEVHTSFSTVKSVNSALIGVAISAGHIRSVNEPVSRYVPEIAGRGFDDLTIRHLLTMSSGIQYKPNKEQPFYLHPFSDDSITYYSPDLRRAALRVQASTAPIGAAFRYNNYYPLLEGLILERVTGMPVAEFLQEKIWKPMGAEYAASWSMDSKSSGFEKMESGLNARAIDYARVGLIYLHDGTWNGVEILPKAWVRESTSPEGAWNLPLGPGVRGYYKYHWWGLLNADGTYDFYAAGHHDQYIYVAPRKNAVIVRLGNAPERNVSWPLIIRSLVDQL
jgi:CubicO group peptidase (beta-lactamase class C family)